MRNQYEVVCEIEGQRTEPVAVSSAMGYFDALSSMAPEVPTGGSLFLFDSWNILAEYVRTETGWDKVSLDLDEQDYLLMIQEHPSQKADAA
jgi:hypothetical protein